jgi:competence protein ComEC
VIRAMIMAVIYLISIIIGRSHFKLNTLGVAAFIILLIDPSAIFDLSFRLSFLSVLGILIINHHYPLNLFTFKDKVLTSLKTTLVATIFTIPLIINSFGIISLLSIPANLVFIPLIEFIVVPLGLISFMLFNISSSVSLPTVELNNQLIGFFLAGVKYLSNLSIASVTVPYLNSLSIILYYLSVFVFFITKSSKRLRFITPVIILLFIVTTSFGYIKNMTNRNLEIYFLDSGIRNTVFVKMENGKNMLISGGDSRFNRKGFIEKNVITSFLLKTGISKVDYLILTENNEDILEGTSYLLDKFNVKYLWTNGPRLNGKVWEEINKKNIKWINIQTDYEPLHFGKTKIDILFSPLYKHKITELGSVSVKLTNENINLLISNDFSNYSNNNVRDKNILFSPYIKNRDTLIKHLNTFGPSVLITKEIYYKYNRPNNLDIYEISRQGMIKIVSKNDSVKIITNNR